VIPLAVLDDIVDRALIEDLGGGDLTSELTVDLTANARAHAVARADLVACGGAVFARTFERVDRSCRVVSRVDDGAFVKAGTGLWTVHAAARSILAAERTALNFVQRMSGIATLARRFVDAVPSGYKTRIVDTRKTTPGLRALERYAVRKGGAYNHRNDLAAAVLIKDNHIVAAGGVGEAIARARKGAPHTCQVEVEVQNLEELECALAAGADIVLLDNFDLPSLTEAVARAAGRALLEASGGIALDRVDAVARTGVDVISVGALTHSAPASDIALDLELVSDG
jgi:nicotinate-nucleotide pyrophosphorylase (carboxylating)